MNREIIIKRLKKFKEENRNKYHIKRIGIFGSVAKNTTNGKNDIDIVVSLTKQDLFDIIGIKQDLEENFHSTVDIVSYRKKMNPFLKKRIDKEAVYV
ncbi:MAG: nucleotidyltransferase domain-containing protein [Candidatus Omnitrophica bacterium]|nr:nucleotidyltransferase domain-containing protein [Candidatus Omnitrophota bacterium]